MKPVERSSSYFVREPRGISTNTSTLSVEAARARRRVGSARAALLATFVLPRVLRRRRDDDRDLALRARGSITSGEVRRRAADDLFVDLRELARDHDPRRGAHRGGVRQQVAHAIRTLVEDDRPALREQPRDLASPRAALLPGEPDEGELAGREPRRDERRDRRGRPRHRDDVVAGGDRRGDELLARIGEARRPGVGHERDVPAAVQLADELEDLAPVVELVV